MQKLKLIYDNTYGENYLLCGQKIEGCSSKISYEIMKKYEDDIVEKFIEYKFLSKKSIKFRDLLPSTQYVLYKICKYGYLRKQDLYLEEFEYGINNKEQCLIIDSIIYLMNNNHSLNVSIRSHSEVILNRIGRHIIENNFDCQKILIYMKDKTKSIECKINEDGMVKPWISGFFEGEDLN